MQELKTYNARFEFTCPRCGLMSRRTTILIAESEEEAGKESAKLVFYCTYCPAELSGIIAMAELEEAKPDESGIKSGSS